MQVSYFKTAMNSKVTSHQSLEKIAFTIRNPTDYSALIEKIREKADQYHHYKDEGADHLAKECHDSLGGLKRSLPGVTFGADYENRRARDEKYDPTGYTIVDVDGVSRDTAVELRNMAKQLPGCHMAFVSPSAFGCKFLVHLNPVPKDPEQHEHATQQVQVKYQELIGVKVDPSGKDVSRLCYLSSDVRLYFDTLPEAFTWDPKQEKRQWRKAPSKSKVTIEQIVEAHGKMKRVGDRYRGAPCPVCQQGTNDKFWVEEKKGNILVGCNDCGTGTEFYKNVLQALGLSRSSLSKGSLDIDGIPDGTEVFSERQLADLYVDHVGENRRYDMDRDAWFSWEETGWCETFSVADELTSVGQHFFMKVTKDGAVNDIRAGGKLATAKAAEAIAQTRKGIRTVSEDWDNTPNLIGIPDGKIVDCTEGKLDFRMVNHEDMIRKVVSQVPCEDSKVYENSRWMSFLRETFDSEELIEWLQTVFGYALLGRDGGDTILFFYGPSGCGKGTTLEAISSAMGNYAVAASHHLLDAKHPPTHQEAVAQMAHARLVRFNELPSGITLNEAFLNNLTGGNRIRANFMRQNSFEFTSHAVVTLEGNSQPILRTKSGLDRRIKVIKCKNQVTEEKRDEDLRAHLRSDPIEQSVIVAWLLGGAERYLSTSKKERKPPDGVGIATTDFLTDATPVGSFVNERVKQTPGLNTSRKEMYAAYVAWCEDNGQVRRMTKHMLGKALREEHNWILGGDGRSFWMGVQLIEEEKKDTPEF